ncbi:MAG: signal recognition particle-docking protein FtsY [Fusobacteriaceae bacterium]
MSFIGNISCDDENLEKLVPLKEKLSGNGNGLFTLVKKFFFDKNLVDKNLLDELEEILVQSDIGMDMTAKIIKALEQELKSRGTKNPAEIYPVLKEIMAKFLVTENNSIQIKKDRLNVILIVGVNGVGKTTTIGKLAAKFKGENLKVIVGAGDTFRAAAVEQLDEWAKRADVKIVKPQKEGGDPAAVVFDTLKIAEAEKFDVAIIDTAGRLHNKIDLMAELEKINKIIKKKLSEKNNEENNSINNSHEILLVIDGTTGQNAIAQAKVFNEATGLTGFIVTKLDGTAKGGVLFAISELTKKPIKFIGVGEKINDLREFNAKEYVEAIFN